MSGPKKSSYEIREEIRARREAERRQRREAQIREIEERIYQYEQQLIELERKYGHIALNVSTNIQNWLSEVKVNIDGDLRDCWRGLKGVENYLNKQEKKLKIIKQKNDAKEQMRQQAEEEKALHQAKIDTILESLESISQEYKEILNDGIRQRIEIFSKSIKANPDNQNTLNQIQKFKSQLSRQYEEYQNKKEDTEYVANTLSKALGGNIKKGNDGSITINGSIEGVQISVHMHQNSKDINMDTPTDGSCRQGLDALVKKLHDANINLGPIKVLKTGQVYNTTTQKSNNQKTKVRS